MAIYLNCSNIIAKAKVSLPKTKAIIKEVELKVKFKYFKTVKTNNYYFNSSINQLSMVIASLELFCDKEEPHYAQRIKFKLSKTWTQL